MATLALAHFDVITSPFFYGENSRGGVDITKTNNKKGVTLIQK